MKKLNFILTIFLIAIVASCNSKNSTMDQTVNAVLGDASFVAKFGNQPAKTASEQLRIQTHLEYVEKLLRSKDVTHLTNAQKRKRLKTLNLLHDYWTAGIFPKNYDFQRKRIPCFIDKDGNICAVGYLIEQTAGRIVAEHINSKYKYEYVLNMNDNTIDSWIKSNGLTKEECAMIQPSYGNSYPNSITPVYGVTSGAMGILNLSLNIVNGVQMDRLKGHNGVPVLGIISGAGQITIGAFNLPKEETIFGQTESNGVYPISTLVSAQLRCF